MWTQAGWTVHNKGDIYIAGGSVESNAGIYHVWEDRWDILPNLPQILKDGPLMFVEGHILYAIDGFDTKPSRLEKSVRSLDLNNISNGWNVSGQILPFRKSGPKTIARVGATIYVVGEYDGYSKTVTSFNVANMNKEDVLNAMRGSTGVAMNVKRKERDMCVTTDKERYIWVVAGCRVCSIEEFVEQYDVQENIWLKVGKNVPSYDLYNNNTKQFGYIAAHGCSYSNGFIFVLFSKTYDRGLDRHFYVFDTVNNTWSKSPTKVEKETYWPVMAAIMSAKP